MAAVVSLTNVSDELALTAIGASDYAVKNVSTNLNPATAVKGTFETVPTAFAAMKAEDAVWAYFGIESKIDTDLDATRSYAESSTEIFGYSTDSAEGKTAADDDVLSDGFNDQSLYSLGFWSGDDDVYPEMQALARLAVVQVPGQTTLNAQSLAGVTVDKDATLNASESVIVRNKNANTYELVGGLGYVRDGKSI